MGTRTFVPGLGVRVGRPSQLSSVGQSAYDLTLTKKRLSKVSEISLSRAGVRIAPTSEVTRRSCNSPYTFARKALRDRSLMAAKFRISGGKGGNPPHVVGWFSRHEEIV